MIHGTSYLVNIKLKTKRNLKFYRELLKKLPDNWNDEIETFLREIAEKKDLASENHLKFFLNMQ